MSNQIPLAYADIELQLAGAISVSDTSLVLSSSTDDDGNALPAGKYCFTIDNGSTNICTTDRKLRWIAVRGGIPDWAVYFEPCYSDDLLFPTIWDDDLIKRI